MLYKIRRPNIKKVAMVAAPASGNSWHLLKTAGDPPLNLIKPARPDWKVAHVVVAAPGRVEKGGITPDGQIAKDDSGRPIFDVWPAEEIREAAHSFVRNGGHLSDAHFEDGSELGRYVESHVTNADQTIDGLEIPAGSWVLGVEPTEQGRAAIEEGRIGGVSVEGDAVREPVIHEAAADNCDCVDQLVEDVTVSLVKQAVTKAAMSTKQRKRLPSSAFAGPGRSYPVHDRAHAANALSRAAQNASPAVRAKIKAAVCRKYPSLPSCKS